MFRLQTCMLEISHLVYLIALDMSYKWHCSGVVVVEYKWLGLLCRKAYIPPPSHRGLLRKPTDMAWWTDPIPHKSLNLLFKFGQCEKSGIWVCLTWTCIWHHQIILIYHGINIKCHKNVYKLWCTCVTGTY